MRDYMDMRVSLLKRGTSPTCNARHLVGTPRGAPIFRQKVVPLPPCVDCFASDMQQQQQQ